ncbi:MAG: DUF1598 domain-containing protein, partial [Planctomycetes bacterium]|nr:DUF1598 domain-containing protein [Planctomycetota bacterium]
AAQADFDSLIDLIQSTVSPDTWMENGTGDGEVRPFPNGVYADAKGTLRFAKATLATASLAQKPKRAPSERVTNVRHGSTLRYVSLPRLEAAIHARQMRHQSLPEEMLTLAGLQRVQYVFVTPASGDASGDLPGDLIVAGPAGDWHARPDGKIVSVETGQPIVRLDDLLTLARRHQQRRGAEFGVSINPRQAGLAKIQTYVRASNAQPLEPGKRGDWLEGLQASLGKQDVEFFGIEPDSHVARVLLVADYHMKLIGMGLADGVDGVTSYLETVNVGPDGSLPPMKVLRWWFAMQYEPVATNVERDVYLLRGLGAKVLSENEFLAARGQRVHTGQSEDLNRRFASSFSEAFEAICQKYPLYTELRNVFDLSMVLELVEREGLHERTGWQPTLFANADWLRLPRMRVPTEVETVVNHRVVRRKHIVAGVSGGVVIDARKTLVVEVETGREELAEGKVALESVVRAEGVSGEVVWWWD